MSKDEPKTLSEHILQRQKEAKELRKSIDPDESQSKEKD